MDLMKSMFPFSGKTKQKTATISGKKVTVKVYAGDNKTVGKYTIIVDGKVTDEGMCSLSNGSTTA